MKRILICRLMVFLTVALVSCSDDTSESIPQNPDKDMYLRVNVPRTYASGADETDTVWFTEKRRLSHRNRRKRETGNNRSRKHREIIWYSD